MNQPKQAVVLAGGLGTRLGDKTTTLPKPMMDIAGRPFLDYLIRNLARHGITEVLLSVGHLHQKISRYFGDGRSHDVHIHYALEQEPLGTGGALHNCLHLLAERFFVLNGDTLFDVDFAALALATQANVIALRPVADTARYGRVTLDGIWVTSFEEKGTQGPGAINGGVLCLNRLEIAKLPEGKSSLEHTLLPRLAAEHALSGCLNETFFIDIGLPESLLEAQTAIPQWERKAVAIMER